MTKLALLAAVIGCSHPNAASVDAQTDGGSGSSTPSWPIAVPLHGCSWESTGEVLIGGNPFQLWVDTGSPLLGVAGSACATCLSDGALELYTPGATATDLQGTDTAVYDSGHIQWTGEAYLDTVAVGGASATMSFYAISSDTNFFALPGGCFPRDGILGMQNASGLPAALAAAGAPDVFAMHACRTFSTLWLGGDDPTVMTGAPVEVPMPDDYYVDLTDVSLGGSSVGLPPATYGKSLVDSGAQDMLIPQAAYDAITSALATNATFASTFGSAGWFTQGPCMSPSLSKAQLDAALPPLGLSFGSATVQLAATDSYLTLIEEDDRTVYCPALGPRTAISLGNALIRSHVVVFDRANRMLGIAPTAPCL